MPPMILGGAYRACPGGSASVALVMLHPVGGLAASVYWRRRAFLIAALLLVLVTVYAVFFRGGGSTPPVSHQAFSSPRTSVTPTPRTTPPTVSSTARTSSSPSKTPTSAAAKTCATSQLRIAAAANLKAYPAGAKPTVSLVVTNKGPLPCVANLSDSQIELRVYNGSARVWGSHDCQIAPATPALTLPVGQATRREVQWSGLSSQPACAGVRTRVPAGNYTLYAYLAGHVGTTATFSMAG